MDAKIFVPFNRILGKITTLEDPNLLNLGISMIELFISLVDGQYPEKQTATSSIPPLLLATLDFKFLENFIKIGWDVVQKHHPDYIHKKRLALPLIEAQQNHELGHRALQLVSNCFIFLKILAEYDSGNVVII
jgi:hypothetical protein